MHTRRTITQRSRSLSAFLFMGCFGMVLAILHFGREILIPIALAILLTFVLAPVVNYLRRKGASQVVSVVIAVALAGALLGSIGTVIAFEFKGLAAELPAYQENIRHKIADVRDAIKSDSLDQVKDIAREIAGELQEKPSAEKVSEASGVASTNAPVVVQESPAAAENTAWDLVLQLLGAAGLVSVLVIFMLLRREDLRDRLLQIAGRNRLVVTTRAIEEISQKVSRYLVQQCLLNFIFGLGIAIGLFLIGLPYAMLWGFLAGVARFIPYAGPVLGAIAPMLMSLAVFNSWSSPLIVISLILGWELINNMMLEPVIYGKGIGVSEVALLVMMAFWTWIWGAVGLVLAAPMTVCIVVFCRGVPELKFISVLLDSKAALPPQQAFYQRLLAHNHDEALTLMREHLKAGSRSELFSQLILPVLLTCRRDIAAKRLNEQEQAGMFRLLQRLLDETRDNPASGSQTNANLTVHPLIAGCPALDVTDEMALQLLADLLAAEHAYMPVVAGNLDFPGKVAHMSALKPDIICVGTLVRTRNTAVFDFCQQLHQQFPEAQIVLGCWGTDSLPADFSETDAVSHTCTSLVETKEHLLSINPVQDEAMADETMILADSQ